MLMISHYLKNAKTSLKLLCARQKLIISSPLWYSVGGVPRRQLVYGLVLMMLLVYLNYINLLLMIRFLLIVLMNFFKMSLYYLVLLVSHPHLRMLDLVDNFSFHEILLNITLNHSSK